MASIPCDPATGVDALRSQRQSLRELAKGQRCEIVLEIRDVAVHRKSDNAKFLKFLLGDASGEVEAVLWRYTSQIATFAVAGAVVAVRGVMQVDRWGPSIKLEDIRLAERFEYDLSELRLSAPIPYGEMLDMCDELIAGISRSCLRRLLIRLLVEGEFATRWRIAPAAKFFHQAYQHGLLEHSICVALAVSAAAECFPRIDRDVAITGALLHDIGKADAYEFQRGAIVFSDQGKLHGEIPLGYARVREAIEQDGDFPCVLKEALLHIVLSHHGKLENGSPVLPCTREAVLVHAVDDLAAKLGSFDRLEPVLRPGTCWSGFDQGLGTSAWFPPLA